jgi:CheY-like chemotaxis protein
MNSATAARSLPVLVVEDEPAVMAYIRAALERGGYSVVASSSGQEALTLLRERDFLGVISDMRTPGGVSGADVHAWIALHRPNLVPRLLFITGDTVNEETSAILQQTGVPCIEKPFRVQQLLAAVEKTIGKAP